MSTKCVYKPHLSVCANGASTGVKQFRHVVVAAELPQARLQVEVAVEAQGVGAAHAHTVLVRRGLSDDLRVLGGVGDEAVTCLDLVEVQQVGAAVVSHAGAVGTQGQLKVREGPRGDDWQHA